MITTNREMKLSTAKELNFQTFNAYYERLRLLACSAFEWLNMPDEISVRFIEKILFERGRVFFFKDETIGYIGIGGEVHTKNLYGDPIKVSAHALNDYQKSLDKGEYIMIRNNYESSPTEPVVRLFAQRLSQIERSLDVNVNAQKTPVLILCDEKQRLSLKNVYAQYNGNEPVIYGDKALNPEAIKSVNTGAPFVADKLFQAKKEYWNECMTYLGINNANTDKKERLIVPEVEANDQLVDMSAQVMLLTRQQAAAEINKQYGLDVSVRLRVQRDPDDQPDPDDQLKEGEING